MDSVNEKRGSEQPPVLRHTSSGSSIDEKGSEKAHGLGLGYRTGDIDVQEISHDIQALGPDIEEAIEHSKTLTDEEVLDSIHYILDNHSKDPNFPPHVIASADRFINDSTLKDDKYLYGKTWEELKIEAALIRINSPYPEVRAIVDNHDDPSMPISTIRAWVIGIVYVAAGAFINQFFSIRQPGVTLYANVAQLLAFPAGKFFEKVLPTRQFTTFGLTWSLNPGRFNMKEHMLITIMANVGFNTPYTDYIIWVQFAPRFFNQPWARDFGYQILISLSTNFIGYGLAGATRRFLVYPEQCVWPTNLATIALNKAFHSERNEIANGWRVSRMKYFLICFTGMFIYFWFPNYIIQAMSYFNWMVWIKPESVMLAAVTGSVSGLGFNPLPTFDWNQWTVFIDPLINPFFSSVNYFIGALITFPIIIALWVNDVWFTGHLPINSNGVFDNTGGRYNVSRAVNKDGLFDQASFASYSPAYLAAGNILLYGVFFAVYSATVSHAILYHRREIMNGFRNLVKRRSVTDTHQDIHSQMMRSYKEVPEWWYFIVLCIAIGLGAAGIGAWPTHTTPAVVLYGIFLAIIFCVPIGIIKSITNIDITLNVLAEFIGGSWFPGNATAMNFFKSYGYVTTAQTLRFAQDLKLAHYVHMPQRLTFVSQMIATFISTFVCIGILNFQMTSIENVCSPTQANRFTCPGQNTFFTASVLWGTLGPQRMFGVGAIYSGLVYCFLIGFFAPFIFYFLGKKYPIFKSVHLPVIFAGGLSWAPYNLSNIWPAIPVAWLFNFYIKKRYLAWWSKYNYITTSAFTVGIALCGILIFFALQYEDIEIDWSGNNRPFDNCDGDSCVFIPLADGETFGPVVGQFS